MRKFLCGEHGILKQNISGGGPVSPCAGLASWAGCRISLSLSFFLCEMGIRRRTSWEIKRVKGSESILYSLWWCARPSSWLLVFTFRRGIGLGLSHLASGQRRSLVTHQCHLCLQWQRGLDSPWQPVFLISGHHPGLLQTVFTPGLRSPSSLPSKRGGAVWGNGLPSLATPHRKKDTAALFPAALPLCSTSD